MFAVSQWLGECVHTCNYDDSCSTSASLDGGSIYIEAGCDVNGNCHSQNQYCSDCFDMWPGYDTCGPTQYEEVFWEYD